MKTRFVFAVLFCMTIAAFAQETGNSPMTGLGFSGMVTLNGRVFTPWQLAESWREQEGYVIAEGERTRYWL